MADKNLQILREHGFQDMPAMDDHKIFRGKYVFVLQDYVPGKLVCCGADYAHLVQCGVYAVSGIFHIPYPYSLQPDFKGRFGKPTLENDTYCMYMAKSVKDNNWVDVRHMLVKKPYNKTFKEDAQPGDRITLNNIIVDEKDDKGSWDLQQMESWIDYDRSKSKSEKLLNGFDAFVWATKSFNLPAFNLLRYAQEAKMPCYLDSGLRAQLNRMR